MSAYSTLLSPLPSALATMHRKQSSPISKLKFGHVTQHTTTFINLPMHKGNCGVIEV